MKSLAIINQTSPYNSAQGQESLDLALAAATFGQQVSIIFADDGVFQLLANQQPEAIGAKNYSKTFAALEFYDIENIYVCKHSLVERHLTADDLCIDVLCIEPQEINHILVNHDLCLRF